jgi:hypothetical protein
MFIYTNKMYSAEAEARNPPQVASARKLDELSGFGEQAVQAVACGLAAVAGRAENSACSHLKEHYNRRWRAYYHDGSGLVRDP